MKKVFIAVGGREPGKPIQKALEAVSALSNQIVHDPEEADLIVVSSSKEALAMLKEYDEAIVLIAIMPQMNAEENGARSLKKAYPGRIVIGQLCRVEMETEDVLTVPYIIAFGGENKEEK
jgi:hypothetical protein